jgi:hypothetical protein
MAASGAMPASLAAEFTPGEDAALCIIADECRVHGIWDLSNDTIAAKAGGAASPRRLVIWRWCRFAAPRQDPRCLAQS